MNYLVQLLKALMLVAMSATFVTSTAALAQDKAAEQGEKKKKGGDEEPECD